MSGAIANEPTIALVFSPETWVERLHRHLADHGGARVRQIVLEPTLALEDGYDTLVVSDRWPGLTRPFVSAVRERGHTVLGVFDADEPAGRAHLLGLGADATVSSDAPVDEFVRVLAALSSSVPADATRDCARTTRFPVIVAERSRSSSPVHRGAARARWRSGSQRRSRRTTPRSSSTPTRPRPRSRPALVCRSSRTFAAPSMPSCTASATSDPHALPWRHGSRSFRAFPAPPPHPRFGRVTSSTSCASSPRPGVRWSSKSPVARDGEIARAVTELAGTAVVVGSATPVGIARRARVPRRAEAAARAYARPRGLQPDAGRAVPTRRGRSRDASRLRARGDLVPPR